MARKIPALQGPLKSWTTTQGWRFQTWSVYRTLAHPWGVAFKLTERGEAAKEAQRFLRNHGYKVGAWWIVKTENVAKLRPVWVAGFRRCPTKYEIENECLLAEDLVEGYVRG